jgi:hypothetical protein
MAKKCNVHRNTYASYSGIAGYGRSDGSLIENPCYEIGWNHDDNG